MTDDKALLIVNCEAGAYNTIDLAWVVSRKKTLASRAVRLRLPFNRGVESNDMELMNAFFDEKTRELVTLGERAGVNRLWYPDALAFMMAIVFVWCVMPKNRAAITGTGRMPGLRCGSRVESWLLSPFQNRDTPIEVSFMV
ncbi:putative periplasmic protein [Salmonella enterica subsp. enterica]|uniref:Putative periplasmic protein n=1 Tax=Salmonella enterica I TaxID=59201 RepID=A0A447PCA0_SALET|nr:putative periplasmic protein [Salmonella enterica subsp. enterica]